MKKIYILLSIFLLLFSLTSCSLLFDFSSGNEPISINYYDNSGNLINHMIKEKMLNLLNQILLKDIHFMVGHI